MNYSPTSIIAQHPTWYYGDFEQRIWQMATAFQQQNVRTVVLWFEDSAKLSCTLFACWHAKVRVLFLSNFTDDSLNWANEQADLWLTDTALSLPTPPKAPIVSFADFANDVNETAWQTFSQQRHLTDFFPETEFLLTTSGSTGKPKIIVKTAGQLWRNAQVCADAFGLKTGNHITAVCTVSIQHLYGLICQIMMPMVLGWQLARKQQFFPEDVAQACKLSEKAVLISSPTMLANIDWQRLNFENVTHIVSAGGMLPTDVSQKIANAIGLNVTDFYGSTEAGAIAWRRGTTWWQPMPNATVGVDERSALWIEADWLVGREQSEDVVEFTEKGFEMLGRADRIIKLGDKRISLAGVEQDLRHHDFVSDCYVGKHPEPHRQHRLVAWLALSESGLKAYQEGRKNLIETLSQHLAKTQEKMAIPRFWRFTDKLPRNSQSKISKVEFEKICLADERDQFTQNEQTNQRA